MAKTQKWKKGDVFLVPLLDGSYCIGQVIYEAAFIKTPICAFFDLRRNEDEINVEELSSSRLIAVQFVTRDSLGSGRWRIFENQPTPNVADHFNILALENSGFVGVEIRGSGAVTMFLNAFYALSPWNEYFDPNYFDTLLISQDMKPKELIFK